MDWQRQKRSAIVFASLYGVICCLIVAVAVWTLFDGYRLGAALVGATALPFVLFTAMKLNSWLLIRKMIGKQGDTHA